VKPYLLDTNVLIALAWPNHVHHAEARAWFTEKGRKAFRTCPITQAGFVRISSNPSFTPQATTPGQALGLLRQVAQLPGHEFWPDDLLLWDAAAATKPWTAHRQITDAYLLALAFAHEGVLATLDRGVSILARSEGGVEVIRQV
jgi:uncharacterized protein